MNREAIESHYLSTLGETSRRARFTSSDQEIDILKWDPSATTEEVALYATIGGGAQRPAPARNPSHRVEFILGLLPERDAVAEALAELATEGGAVDHGHTVRLTEPLWPGTEMDAFLLMRPAAPVVPTLVLPDGSHCEFLSAIPIYRSEIAFKAHHGASDLMEVWREQGIVFSDPDRVVMAQGAPR